MTPFQTRLAPVLVRIAAHHGEAVPRHRFELLDLGYVVNSEEGLQRQAIEDLWRSVFPLGAVEVIDHQRVTREDFPLLWISELGDPLLLVGKTASGKALILDFDHGQNRAIDQPLSSGVMLRLVCVQITKASGLELNDPGTRALSAREWFLLAIRKRGRIFVEGGIATLLVGLFGLATSLYTMQVYDRVIPNSGFSTLAVLTLGVSISILMELLVKHIRAAVVERSCKAIDQELSGVFFAKALSIRLDARPKTVGTFASQIRHFESVRNFMTSATLMVLADFPLAILFLFVIFFIGGWVVVAPIFLIPLAIFVGLMFRKPIRRLSTDQLRESNQKNGLLVEAIDGIESLKASGAEWKVQSRWDSLTDLLAAKELQLKLLTNLSANLSQTIHQVTYVGVIAVGAVMMTEGEITMGGLIACSILSSRALQPIAQLPNILTQWQSSEVALEALDSIMALPDDRVLGNKLIVPEYCKGKLSLEEVKFSYEQGGFSVELPKLSFSPGERVAIVGGVGSGKSTLIKLLAGLYKPQEGKVKLDDLDFETLSNPFVREHLAYLPQDVRLFGGTLRENLLLGLAPTSDAVVIEAARTTGLLQAVEKHPKGLDLPIYEGGKGLSGGQRQLVGLTRMLIARPSVLIMDEPTASMDGQLENHVMRHLFESLPPSSTILMATHKASSLRHVTRLIVMAQGRVALDGPRDDVLAKIKQLQPQEA